MNLDNIFSVSEIFDCFDGKVEFLILHLYTCTSKKQKSKNGNTY